MYYDSYNRNVYSQNGEDGILEVIISELGIDIPNMWLCECGAYDGISYSHVRLLIERGANAVMIEPCFVGDLCEEKFTKLQHLPKIFPKVHTLNHFTKISNKDISDAGYLYLLKFHKICGLEFSPPQKTLDESLREIPTFPEEYDLLNIDIDSYDHNVWVEHKLNPKIVVIEVNSSLPPIPTDKSRGWSFGDSLELGMRKGYSCVCHTGNMIYIRNDLLNKLSLPKELINSIKLFNQEWMK